MAQKETEIKDKIIGLLKDGTADYRQILRLSCELSKLDEKFQRFFVDAKTLIHLGRDSIKDHTTALIELVKNSYDADAFNVDVDIFCKNGADLIRVADNGFGMTKEQLLNNWLRIGFSSKRQSKTSNLGRRKTGEKGIGRISTDRIGAQIELISKTETDGLVGLKVNWDEFDKENKDVFDIDIEITKPNEINIPQKDGKDAVSGTEIKISALRQPWSADNIEGLYIELSALTPPFNEIKDFAIKLHNDVAPDFSRPVYSKYYETAEIDVSAVFDGTNEVVYAIKDKHVEESIVEKITLQQYYSKVQNTTEGTSLKCGPLEVRLLFFLRQGSSVMGTDFKLSDLREFLDNNAGVKIYRDNIAVKPYGFPKAQMGYDWLDLDRLKAKNPAGVGRGDEYAVSSNQLVGAVFISRDNNVLLTDSAAREGLVESEGFYDMKNFIYATLRLLVAHRSEMYPIIEREKKKRKKLPVHKEAEQIKAQLNTVKDDLSTIKKEIETDGDNVAPTSFLKPITQTIERVDTVTEEVGETITELLNWQRTVNGLATIGISSAVFAHETEGSITQFQGSTNTAIKLIKAGPTNTGDALEELEKAYRHSRKVASWGAYALTRVQKEKRKKKRVQIYKTIEGVIKELKPAFEASTINLSLKGENLYGRTYPMDIESILVNLLTNAYTATLLKTGERKIVVAVGREDIGEKKGFFFSVSDTGPGVAKEFEHRIFDPLFSTKTIGATESKSIGTGLGLTIAKSIVEELEGKISFSRDLVLGGAIFKIWLPKED